MTSGLEQPLRGAGNGAAAASPAWHALDPDAALAAQGVTVDAGLTSAEADARRAKYGKNTFAEAKKVSRWQAFSRQYADPMQIVLLIAGIVCLFLPGQFYTGVFLILLTLFNAWMAHEPGGQGGGERVGPRGHDGRQGQGPPERRPRRAPDGGARPGRHRQHRGRRPRSRGRAHPDRGDPRDRRVRAHRRERADPQAGGRRRRRRRARGPRGHGVHELPGHPRGRHDPRRHHGHGDRGRPHQRHAPGAPRSRRPR